jgi:steroid delta-isomerase-like uncharacterized protein
MNEKDLTRVAREIVSTYSTADWKAMKGILTTDAVYNEIGSQRKLAGPDSIIQALQGWKQAMTDSKGTVTNSYVSGDTVTLEVTWQGTHNGPLNGPAGTIPASGKHQTTQAVMIVRFQGDKVKEIRHYFDMMTIFQQIGAMPAMAGQR